jgi:hypothetical protein
VDQPRRVEIPPDDEVSRVSRAGGRKSLLLKEAGFGAIWSDLLYLLCFAAVMLTGSRLLFKRTLSPRLEAPMRYPSLLTIAVLLSTSLLFCVPPQGGNKAEVSQRFLGAWRLAAAEQKGPDGVFHPQPDLGPHAKGFIMYTPDGHMCAQLMNPERPEWADPQNPTEPEHASAGRGFISYCGRFEVNEGEQMMIHYPETAFQPNYVGTVQKRPYRLEGADRLIYSVKIGGADRRIVWERLK